MKVVSVGPFTGNVVETDEGNYVRFGPGAWYEWMGESLEPTFYYEEDLEEAFQEWAKSPL